MEQPGTFSPFAAATYQEQEQAFKLWQQGKPSVAKETNDSVKKKEMFSLPPLEVPQPVCAPVSPAVSCPPFRHGELDKLKERHKTALRAVGNWQSTLSSDVQTQPKKI